MIVADTNVITYLFIHGEKTAQAQSVAQTDPIWIVPYLWRHEFLNVLATYARQGGVSLEAVKETWYNALSMLIRAESQVDMGLALELAVKNRISAYDAQFIALAQSLSVPCITEDRRLIRSFPETALSMEAYIERG